MPKTKEELTQLKTECESLTTKLKELSEDELKEVCVGTYIWDIAVKFKELFDINKAGIQSGSIQEIIGDWSKEEHHNK